MMKNGIKRVSFHKSRKTGHPYFHQISRIQNLFSVATVADAADAADAAVAAADDDDLLAKQSTGVSSRKLFILFDTFQKYFITGGSEGGRGR